ncbi:MAG: hypothetical protein ACE361_20210 [Aureliella sp.]
MNVDQVYEIHLSDQNGAMIPAKVEVDLSSGAFGHYQLRISWQDGTVEAEDYSVYHAFALAREKMEPLGLVPQCYGACPEVHVSGMAVEMGHGISAYKLSRPDERWDAPMVNIFDNGPDVHPASVEAQRNYRS